jgi:hypothetical protein
MAHGNGKPTREFEIRLNEAPAAFKGASDDPRVVRVWRAARDLLHETFVAAMQPSDLPAEPIEMSAVEQVRWQGRTQGIPIKIKRLELDERMALVVVKPERADNSRVYLYAVRHVPPLALRKFHLYLDAPIEGEEKESDDMTVTPAGIASYIESLKPASALYREQLAKRDAAKRKVAEAEEAFLAAQVELEAAEKDAQRFHAEHLAPKMAEVNRLQAALAEIATLAGTTC